MVNTLILTSEFPPQPGGIGNHALNLAKGLHENGFNVKLISDVRSRRGEEERSFDSTLPFEIVRIPRKKIIFFSYLDRLFKALSLTGESDIIICSGKFSLWLGAFLRVFYKGKFVAVIHGSEIKLPNWIWRRFTERSLQAFDIVIAVSNYTKSLVSHLKLSTIHVIPNGFVSEVPTVSSEKNKPLPVLITVGHVTKRKGQQNVIRALPLVRSNYPDAKYQIVGIPTDQTKLEHLALKLGLESSVTFFGNLPDTHKFELLQQADIFVMLSQPTKKGDVEGFGIAILEANALGIPAIGAKGCGIEDAIKDGFSGRLIDGGDPREFLTALKEILGNYEAYSNQAKKWAQKFTWNKIIKKYLEVL